MSNNQVDQIVIFGKKGFGKSHLAKEYIIPELLKFKPVFTLDTTDEYLGDYEFQNIREMTKFLIDAGGIEKKHYVLKCRSDLDRDNFFRAFDSDHSAGGKAIENCALVIEEADKFCKPTGIHPNLENIINYGRHDNIDLIFLARRYAKVHKDLTSQADVIVSFQQTDHNDIRPLSKDFDNANLLKELEPTYFLTLGNSPPKKLKLFTPGEIKKL